MKILLKGRVKIKVAENVELNTNVESKRKCSSFVPSEMIRGKFSFILFNLLQLLERDIIAMRSFYYLTDADTKFVELNTTSFTSYRYI